MAYGSDRLPSRFPVGTKFVIEGKRGREGQVQVFSRYLEFPGRDVLPAAGPARQTQIGASRTTRPAITFARPLTQRSSRDLVARPGGFPIKSWVGFWTSTPVRARWPSGRSSRLSLSANGLSGNPSNNRECENPSLRWAGVDGRSVNRLFPYALRHMSRVVAGDNVQSRLRGSVGSYSPPRTRSSRWIISVRPV